ncbi:MAG: ParB N-terminal domain-containing protein [Gammaproteobacteria bacterium]|nr:ParB N-terminal domain-containing protein [Gammaproteobacteria bacterium]
MPFVTAKIAEIESNPFRNPESYVFDEGKIAALAESIGDTSFWENLLARKTKDGRIQLAYGHHRLQALKKLVEEGMTEFTEIKINVRPETQLTAERMLKIFAQENKDDWGENPQNLCMTVLQLQSHLENLLAASKDKDQFLKKVGDQGALKVDDRSFTRMKNHGVGASTIAAFLGDCWSRQTIHDALQVIENDEATFKLAQQLPNVTLANRFQKLVTKAESGKGQSKTVEMFPEDTQRKVQDKILKHDLTRAEVEDAIKISKGKDEGPDPVSAINEVVEKKKAKLKASKEAADALKPSPKEPHEKILVAIDRVIELIRKERISLEENHIDQIEVAMDIVQEELDKEPEVADPIVSGDAEAGVDAMFEAAEEEEAVTEEG